MLNVTPIVRRPCRSCSSRTSAFPTARSGRSFSVALGQSPAMAPKNAMFRRSGRRTRWSRASFRRRRRRTAGRHNFLRCRRHSRAVDAASSSAPTKARMADRVLVITSRVPSLFLRDDVAAQCAGRRIETDDVQRLFSTQYASPEVDAGSPIVSVVPLRSCRCPSRSWGRARGVAVADRRARARNRVFRVARHHLGAAGRAEAGKRDRLSRREGFDRVRRVGRIGVVGDGPRDIDVDRADRGSRARRLESSFKLCRLLDRARAQETPRPDHVAAAGLNLQAARWRAVAAVAGATTARRRRRAHQRAPNCRCLHPSLRRPSTHVHVLTVLEPRPVDAVAPADSTGPASPGPSRGTRNFPSPRLKTVRPAAEFHDDEAGGICARFGRAARGDATRGERARTEEFDVGEGDDGDARPQAIQSSRCRPPRLTSRAIAASR